MIAEPTLTVYMVNFPPLVKVEDGAMSGYFPEFYEAILGSSIKTKFSILPLARYNHLVSQGTMDIGVWPAYVSFPTHKDLGYVGDIGYGLLSTTEDIDLKNDLGCTTNNSPVPPPGQNLVVNHSFAACIQMLKSERVDYIFVLTPIILEFPELDRYHFTKLGEIKLHLYVSYQFESYFEQITKKLHRLRLKDLNRSYYIEYKNQKAIQHP